MSRFFVILEICFSRKTYKLDEKFDEEVGLLSNEDMLS
jgi:hypothetical protein